jgi:hypothetical protein
MSKRTVTTFHLVNAVTIASCLVNGVPSMIVGQGDFAKDVEQDGEIDFDRIPDGAVVLSFHNRTMLNGVEEAIKEVRELGEKIVEENNAEDDGINLQTLDEAMKENPGLAKIVEALIPKGVDRSSVRIARVDASKLLGDIGVEEVCPDCGTDHSDDALIAGVRTDLDRYASMFNAIESILGEPAKNHPLAVYFREMKEAVDKASTKEEVLKAIIAGTGKADKWSREHEGKSVH